MPIERTVEHFGERLEKDSYSKDEVSKMLHSEAQFTERQTKKGFDGFVPQDKFNEVQTSLNETKEALAPFQKSEWDKGLNSEFSKMNGLKDRLDDFKSIAKFDGSEDSETINKKVIEMKESKKYDFLFSNSNSKGNGFQEHGSGTPNGTIKGSITPKVGSFNFFKKK